MSIIYEFEYVSAARPYPLCGRGDWRLLARDGSMVICEGDDDVG